MWFTYHYLVSVVKCDFAEIYISPGYSAQILSSDASDSILHFSEKYFSQNIPRFLLQSRYLLLTRTRLSAHLP